MPKDKVFDTPVEKQFEFDQKVAAVFDDMLDRSIPFYRQNMYLICEYLAKTLPQDAAVLDLGCSTANMLLALHSRCAQNLNLCGIDDSEAMIEKARAKAGAYEAAMELSVQDVFGADFGSNDCIISNYLLQFIRPMQRGELVAKIYDSLRGGGVFVCSEKVVFDDKAYDKTVIDLYYDYKKKQGYSQTEITQKREALENVLIPYTIEENITMFKQTGFSSVQTLFQWGNFVTFVAKKS